MSHDFSGSIAGAGAAYFWLCWIPTVLGRPFRASSGKRSITQSLVCYSILHFAFLPLPSPTGSSRWSGSSDGEVALVSKDTKLPYPWDEPMGEVI